MYPPALTGWSAQLFPATLGEATARLRARLTAWIGPDGAIRDGCRSRVFESALALNLLEHTGLECERRDRLVDYLHDHVAVDPLDQILVDLALTRTDTATPPAGLAEAFIAQAPDFTSARKNAMFEATFALYGRTPDKLDPEAFAMTGLHSWARVQVTAVKVVLADATGQHELIDDEDVRILLETQRRDHVWESNVLIHLWTLHALHRLPNTEQVVAQGIAKALAHQRDDGGMPFSSDTDTWCTATAGVALAATGADPDVLHTMAAHLVSEQRPGGGWSYTDLSDQTDIDDTSVAVQFLSVLDPDRYLEQICRGERSLLAVHNPDGGFPTYIVGAASEACMTAAAVDALTLRWKHHHSAIVAGLEFLADQQCDDGTFPPDWSSSRWHTLFRALLAASRNPGHWPIGLRNMVDRIIGLVLATQNDDGGWGQQEGEPSDAISTAYALIAVCHQDDPRPAARAAGYLLACQREDGGIDSISDSIGPRPLRFTIAVLADIFTLLALGHLSRRMALS